MANLWNSSVSRNGSRMLTISRKPNPVSNCNAGSNAASPRNRVNRQISATT